MDCSWIACITILFILHLLQAAHEADALQCYKCSYYTHSGVTVKEDCAMLADCKVCQTRVYQEGDDTELVSRDCVSRCTSSGVPIIFENLKDKSAVENCCTTDLCNTHPGSASTHTPSTGLLCVLIVISLCKALHYEYIT